MRGFEKQIPFRQTSYIPPSVVARDKQITFGTFPSKELVYRGLIVE
jgi:hypothetical protein